ncbi:MAG: DUF2760 domain-containing protein [Nitrospirae bacterium]|nr:DUF2760 domain-containing protein [Nitrospirota bacterium]
MVSKEKLFLVIFVFVTGSMAALSVLVPVLSGSSRTLAAVIFGVAGIITSVIVYGVVSYVIKMGQPPTSMQSPTAMKPPADQAQKASVRELPELARTTSVNDKTAHVLSMLQKKGRLIDFLQEDISVFDDKQIGNAVRSIHKGCKEALVEYMKIEPVMNEMEGREVTVESGFDPSAIRLTGNVSGKPPFRGVLRHCGWRLSASSLPSIPKNQDLSIIEPAEVEIL